MPEEKTLITATLVFLVRDDLVLLARKVRKIGAGKWNGYGGGIEGEETTFQCAVRELGEEAGVESDPNDLEKVGEVTFHNTKSDGSKFSCLVHIYLLRRWAREPRASKEMADPTWFEIHRLPVAHLMPADPFWLPLILSGKKIVAEAHYGPFQAELLAPVKITEVDRFDE